MLTWNVFIHDTNPDKIISYNIFNHYRFAQDLVKNKQKNKDFESFAETLRRDLKYYFWAKCEWEIIVSAWCGGNAKDKVDVYEQVMLNWDLFVSYVWNNKKLITKKKLGLKS